MSWTAPTMMRASTSSATCSMTLHSPVHRLLSLLGALALGAAALPAAAQTDAITIVVPYAQSGPTDRTLRAMVAPLSQALGGTPITVKNVASPGGVKGLEEVAKAAPDGYTLLLMSNGTAVSAGLFKSLPFDTAKDFAPVSTLGFFDLSIVVADNSRFKTLGELLAYARANPGKLNVGTINVGSTQNLAAELFKTSAGVDVQVVPFNGTPAVITALRGGQIDAAVEILSPVVPQINARALRALAVMGEKRSATLPDVPTVAESGLKGFNVASWNAVAAPAKTPAAVVQRLNREIQAALKTPEVQKQLLAMHIEARGGSPEQLGQLLASETQRWGDVITRANIPRQ